jgi:hypothetical protein
VQVARQLGRPRIAAATGRRREAFPGRALPARAREIAQRRGRIPVHRERDAMTRRMALAGGQAAPRIVVGMRAAVPAVDVEVAAAAEGERVVDHHHLLVVAGARRVAVVEPEVHPAVEPLPGALRVAAPGQRNRQRHVPDKHPDVDLRPLRVQRTQHVADALGLSRVGGIRHQRGARVELPSQKQHRGCAWRNAAHTAAKYAWLSTSTARRCARSMRQQVVPAERSGREGGASPALGISLSARYGSEITSSLAAAWLAGVEDDREHPLAVLVQYFCAHIRKGNRRRR